MEKLKNKKWIGALVIIIVVIAITALVMAGDTVKYLCTIKDTGISQAKANEQSIIHRQILQNESTSSELVFEAKVKNTAIRRRDIAVVLDTSRSMSVNTDSSDVYAEAKRFINGFYNYYPGSDTYVSVSNNTNKIGLTVNKNTVLNGINTTNFPSGQVNDLNAGLNNAYSTFDTSAESEKFLVVFTDATDEVKETLVRLDEEYGINVISILINLNSNQFTVTEVVKQIYSNEMGKVNYQDIYSLIAKGMHNVVLEDRLSQKAINYFDFEVDPAYVNNVEFISEKGKNIGFRYTIDELQPQHERKIKYRLRLKANINSVMDIGDVYGPDIATNENLKLTYNFVDTNKTLETQDSPLIQIGKAFSVTLIAVNETTKNVPVQGVEFRVVAKEVNSGKVLVDGVYYTSSTGKIVLEDLISTDNILFDVTPNVTQVGYTDTPPSQFTVEYNQLNRKRVINDLDIVWEDEETRANLNVYFAIMVNKFNFNVELRDLNNDLTKIGKSEFQLVQPKLNSYTEMDVLKGVTHDTTGIVSFRACAMTQDGYYDYILSQLSVNNNFELMGSSRIRVWFRGGNVVGMKVMDNPNVSDGDPAYTANSVNVIVGNLSISQESFELRVQVRGYEPDLTIPGESYHKVSGATYRIKTTTTSGQIINYGPYVTDEEGCFTTTLYGAGYVKIEIFEETPNPAYVPSPEAKYVTVYRNYGTVERLATAPVGMSAWEDSDHNAVDVLIRTNKKADQNVVRLELVETTDERVKIKNIPVDLIKISDGTRYTVVSDEDGIAEFPLPDQREGIYQYRIEMNDIPAGYKFESDILIDVEYNSEGRIEYTNIPVVFDSPILKYEPIDEETSTCTKIGQYLQLGIDFEYTDGCNFTVKLLETKTSNPIPGGKYDIKIIMTLSNGETVEKEIKNAITDAQGQIVTPLIKGDYIDIQVQQTESVLGYKIDDAVQDISITNENGVFKLITDSPHNESEGMGMGTTIYGDEIVYTHKNAIISTEDTYLNLHITKKDEEGAFISGIGLRISAEEEELVRTDNGVPIRDDPLEAITNINGEVDLLRLIRVLKVPDDGTTVTYNFTVVEYDLLSGENIQSSLVKYRIVYRFNPNSSQVELKNLDIIIGKRLEIYSKHSGYLTSYGYESRVELDILTNYGEVGNFSIDLSKYDNNGEKLEGAIYKITVMRPSGCISTYEKEVTDKIELPGFFVSEETTIEIQEIQAPVGYNINSVVEVIRITGIDDITKAIQMELESTPYNPARAVIEQDNDILLNDGTMKKEVSLKLIDYEEDTFKFGIETIDSESIRPVKGYEFKVTSSKGAYQISKPTDGNGKTSLLVGGTYKDEGPITYKIESATVPAYYKELISDIEVQVYFDLNGSIDVEATMAGQTDEGYGTIWSIVALNTPNGNAIDVRIIVDPQPKLTVNIDTKDEFSKQTVPGVRYRIPESINIIAEGTTELKVGYVVPNGTQNYTLQNTDVSSTQYKYNKIPDQKFQVQYDSEGNITGTPTVQGEYIKYISHEGREINLEITIEPKVAFTIVNTEYQSGIPLQSAKFEITNLSAADTEVQTGITDAQGYAKICNGRHGKSIEMIYLVKQPVAKIGYAKVEDFYVKVTYDANKVITNATLSDVNGNPIANSDNIWVNVSRIVPNVLTTGYNGNEQGIVMIEVANYPAVRFNIENVDRRDDTIKLGGTEYSVTSTIDTGDMTAPTDNTTGMTVAYLDKSRVGGTAVYTIRQTKASAGYQTIEPIMLKLYFDNRGFISTTNPPELIKMDGENEVLTNVPYVTYSSIPESERTTLQDNFIVNIQIRNNPLLKLKIDKKDEAKEFDVNNVEFVLTGVDKETNEELVSLKETTGSTAPGQLIFNIDKTLDNKIIEYTIRETKKAVGYKWMDEQIKIEVQYDKDGRIVETDGCKVTAGLDYIEVTNVDSYNFKIDTIVMNEEIEEFGVHMIVEDRYDPSKKLGRDDGHRVNMKLNNDSGTTTSSDTIIEMGTINLISGRDSDGDGIPDVAYGEDYQSFGEMVDDEGKAFKVGYIYINPQNTPNHYHKGTEKKYTTYQNIKYQMVVKVTFDDEGRIATANIHRAWDRNWADDQYMTLSYTPGKYTLTIRIHYFPMVQIGINSVDEYTKERLGNSNFEISTRYGMGIGGTEYQQQSVKAGWIGQGFVAGNEHDTKLIYGTTYTINYAPNPNWIANASALAPIESKENATLFDSAGVPFRRVYIYEKKEPNYNGIQYQKYRPRYNVYQYDSLLAYIDIYYNSKGEIEKYKISPGFSTDNNNTPNGTYFVKKAEKQVDNPHSLVVDIEYKPATTFKVNVIDQATRVKMGDFRLYPFLNQSSILTNRSYEYRTQNYYEVNQAGEVGWTYWGGNSTLSDVTYKIGTEFRGNRERNYGLPGNVEIQITHDQHGRISNAQVLSTNSYNEKNAEIVGYARTTVEINILCYRKFNVQLYKRDKYEKTKALHSVVAVTSSEGLQTSIQPGAISTLGLVYPGKLVRYTISETTAPQGYLPLEIFELDVFFNNNGTIRYTKVNSTEQEIIEQYEQLSTFTYKDELENETYVALTANLYDKPCFTLQLDLRDEFYPDLKLQGGQFEITNTKGDMVQGTPITNENGFFEVYMGQAYRGETVEYTIKQVNVVPGYYPNTNIATLIVKFKNDGRIESYSIKNPAPDNYFVDMNAYVNQKYVKVLVTNMPKDVKLGITKYDQITNEKMEGIEFKVTKEYVSGDTEENQLVTDVNGVVTEVIDEFKERKSPLVVKYTISEITQPNTYRKIQDIVIQVRYAEDGRIDNYQILSNPSRVGVEVAINSRIKYTGGKPVHIALVIPNDNAYDLTVKNEDINYEGLGIMGTQFDVTINGMDMGRKSTDNNGKVQFLRNTQSGRIEIRVSQVPNGIGEGYRENLLNDVTFVVNKGEEEYSLDLDEDYLVQRGYTFTNTTNNVTNDEKYEVVIDEETNTKAIITINEVYGTINVVLKNETKLELTMIKHDIDTNELLQNARFEVIQQVVAPIEQAPVTITTEYEDDITDENGKLYFDLGVAPQSQEVKYTFKEITPPMNSITGQPYAEIPDTEVFVKFDAYGRIDYSKGVKESSPRASAYMGSQTGLSHSINVEIANGALNQGFKIKVISQDSQSESRLNGSIFEVEVRDVATGNSLFKDILGITKNNPGLNGIVTQSGTYITPSIATDFEGEMEISVNQVVYLEGYVGGDNITSGRIVIEKDNIDTGESTTADIDISYISSDFNQADVNIDVDNREITVIVRNDPQLLIDLTKVYVNREGKLQNLEGAVFDITSQVIENETITDTDLDLTTYATNENGYTSIKIPIKGSGQKVVYTLKEHSIQSFDTLPDIKLEVTYDINNNIKEYNILGNPDTVAVAETRIFEVVTYGIRDDQRVIIDRKEQEIGIPGRKVLPMGIKNSMTPIDTPYVIEIEKIANGSQIENTEENENENIDKSPILLPGARYEIRVVEEFGIDITWEQYSDENGMILTRDFTGYGTIRVAITELEAPAGYKIDNTTRHMEFTRDKITGEIIPIDIACDVDYKISSDNTKVTLSPKDDPTTLTMYLYKIDKANRFRITEDTAKFEVYLSEDGSIVKVGEGETDSKGALILTHLQKPSMPGNYDYILREVKSPEGYDKISEDLIINVEFLEDDLGDLYVASKPAEEEEDVEIIRYGKQYISMNIFNHKYSAVKIDAKKVNSITNYRVAKNSGKFEVYLADAYETVLLKTVELDDKGNINFGDLRGPTDPGKCTYIFKEIESPDGYQKYTGEMRIDVTYAVDENDQKYIKDVVSQSTYIKINRFTKDYINMNISNVPDGQSYTLVLEKHTMIDEDFTLIPGGTYRIRVEEEYGKTVEWEDTTNEDGVIISDVLKGYGYINVYLVELSAPKGYILDGTEHHIEFFKDKNTGEFGEGHGDVDFSYADTNKSVVYVKPRDELGHGLYAMIVNKIDNDTKQLIKDNPATFEAYIENPEGEIELLGEITTSEQGYMRLDNLVMPEEFGTYKIILKEVNTPLGYRRPKEIEVEVEFDGGRIAKVTPISKLVNVPKYENNYMILNISNEKGFDDYIIELTKVDSITNEPITDNVNETPDNTPDNDEENPSEDEDITFVEDKKALFEVTDEKGQVQYIYTDENGVAIIENLKPEEIEEDKEFVEKVYTIKEVMAPTGYILNRQPFKVKMKFTRGEEQEIVLEAANIVIDAPGDNIKEAKLDSNAIKLRVANEPGTPSGDYVDRGEYSVILTKIDKETKEIIPSQAELTTALENGQRVLARTKEDGKIYILDIKAPAKAGEYDYVITENLAPEGYILNTEPQLFKVTFEDDPDDPTKLIITNAQVVSNGVSTIIEITSYANNTVEINVENEKDAEEEEKLYLKSKLDENGEVIYDVFQQEDMPVIGTDNPRVKPSQTYKIYNPFIDTKTILEKATRQKLGITVEEFIKNLDTNADEVKVFDADGTELGPKDIIKTLGKVKATKKTNQELNYDLVVKGDINGDGQLRTNDSVGVKSMLAESETFSELQKRAADIDSNGQLRTNDSVAIKVRLAE